MIDLHLLRQDPVQVRRVLARRNPDPEFLALVDRLLDVDVRVRGGIQRTDSLRAQRNQLTQQISDLSRQKQDTRALVESVREIKTTLSDLETDLTGLQEERDALWHRIPNLTDEVVPTGGEENNQTYFLQGEPRDPEGCRPHWEIGEALGILDLPGGAKITGSGFPVLRREGARLQRALIQFMLDLHTREHGYEEVAPPFLVNAESMFGTGQLPKFEEDLYRATDDLFLIPTAEVPVTNLHRNEILSPDQLPISYVAYSPCFRREAGAAGKDTRGLLRLHQFDKVELVRFERPENSDAALEHILEHAAEALRRLGLAFRVVLLAAGDTGFSSAKTYDIEVWAPGVGKWLEVSSASNFRDFQARRAGIRFRPAPGAATDFVHTLNASGLALPRLMVALLETYQQSNGSVRIPEALIPYTGFDRIGV